ARRACRFRLRRGGRGAGADRLPGHRRAVRLRRAAGILAAVAGKQSVHRHRRHRPVRAVRVAGGHQHGVGAPPDADQGHDAALHLLWRLVAVGLGPRHGHGAGLDAAAFRRRRPMSGLIVLAAGGTGGHIFPAEALAGELLGRGLKVALVTDKRGQAFGGRLPGVDLHRIRAGRPGASLLSKILAAAEIALGFIAARKLLRDLTPDAAVGFGGYPSVPTMLAASRIGFPTLIHEQNARLGRANRWLAPRVRRIATAFAQVDGLDAAQRAQAVETGNPVRAAISAVRSAPYAAPETGPIELLVMGGSQGAHILSAVVPAALALLPAPLRARIK